MNLFSTPMGIECENLRGMILKSKLMCADCIAEPFIRDWVQSHGMAGVCDACRERQSSVIAIEDLAEYIRGRLGVEYADSAEWGLDPSDGYATEELLRREGWNMPDGPCFSDLCRAVGTHRWCEHKPYHCPEEELHLIWWRHTLTT